QIAKHLDQGAGSLAKHDGRIFERFAPRALNLLGLWRALRLWRLGFLLRLRQLLAHHHLEPPRRYAVELPLQLLQAWKRLCASIRLRQLRQWRQAAFALPLINKAVQRRTKKGVTVRHDSTLSYLFASSTPGDLI